MTGSGGRGCPTVGPCEAFLGYLWAMFGNGRFETRAPDMKGGRVLFVPVGGVEVVWVAPGQHDQVIDRFTMSSYRIWLR